MTPPEPGRGCAARARPLALLAVLLPLAACSGGGGDTVRTAPSPSAAGSPAPATELVVEAVLGPGTGPVRATLTCYPPSGDHPEPAQACAALAEQSAPFAPLPADLGCTEQYGGPQTARVTGTWDGEPVDLALSRTDGCAITQWDSLGPLLPVPVG